VTETPRLEILGPEAQSHMAGARADCNAIGGAIVFERPDELSTSELIGRIKLRIGSSLDLVPRSTKIAVPLPGSRPAHVLVDGPPIDLDAHVQATALDEVVSRERMAEILMAFADQPLDLERPLWRAVVVPRVEGGQGAVAFRFHHFIQDGVLGIAAGAVLIIDDRPDRALRKPPPYKPAPPPTEADLEAAHKQIVADRRSAVRELLSHAARDPGQALRRVRHIAGTYREQLGGHRSQLLSRQSNRHALEVVQLPFTDVKACQDVLDHHVSVNDVAVTLLVGGLIRMLEPEQRRDQTIRIDVPVTLALQDHGAGDFDQRAAAMVLTVPLDEDDPRKLLRVVNEQSRVRKTTGARDIADLMHALMLLPAPLFNRASGALWSSGNLLFSNIPGPQTDLFIAGNRITSLIGLGNLRGLSSLRVVTLSFEDQVSMGIVYDRAVTAIHKLTRGITETLETLRSA
jgi:diacylglycerol O-acyltransferase / wax synthase